MSEGGRREGVLVWLHIAQSCETYTCKLAQEGRSQAYTHYNTPVRTRYTNTCKILHVHMYMIIFVTSVQGYL